MAVRLLGMEIEVKARQLENARSPIAVMLLGMEIEVRDSQSENV